MPRRSRSKSDEPNVPNGRRTSQRRPAKGKPAAEAAMDAAAGDHAASLTEYESEQVRLIAAWKAETPGLRSGLFAQAGRPSARFAERFIPARVAREAIETVYEEAELAATRAEIERQAGIQALGELRHRPLEECDGLARGAGVRAQGLAVAGGAATGTGGFLTSALDIPLLLGLALRTILKVGHCYGYPLDRPKDRRAVLGILLVAACDDPEKKRELLARLREVEERTVEESDDQLVEDEAMGLLLRVETFDDIPGLGAITAGLENLAVVHQAAEASKRVFQERRLRDDGKVQAIEPAPAECHGDAGARRDGLVPRLTYAVSYYLGFGVMLPVWLVAHAIAPADNAMIRGFRVGASAALEGADRAIDRLPALAGSSPDTPSNTPALAPA